MGELTRLVGAAALPYHLGRLVTYAGLGAIAGGIGGLFGGHNWFTWIAAGLLALAGLSFLGYALGSFGLGLPGLGGIGRRLADIAGPLFARPIGWRGFALGLALGFLPCGLIYAALAAAAASGGALSGALLTGAFALGTVPGLIAVGVLGHLAIARFRAPARRIGAVLMVVNAAVLLWFAGDLVAARF
jgi:sulfite exporter TauE/SafE